MKICHHDYRLTTYRSNSFSVWKCAYSEDIIPIIIDRLPQMKYPGDMARISRLVVPKYPPHITQRGVRSMAIFQTDEDRRAYLQFLAEEAERFGVEILVWCLLTEIFLRASLGDGLQRINNIGIMSLEFRYYRKSAGVHSFFLKFLPSHPRKNALHEFIHSLSNPRQRPPLSVL
jgi:putative transposase